MKYELQNKAEMRMSLQSQQNTITYIKSMGETQDKLDGGLRSPSHDLAEAKSSLPGSHAKNQGNERERSRHNSEYQ